LKLAVDAAAEPTVSPALLAQLLDNLVGNALKYSEPGTSVTLRSVCNGNQLSLSVTDQGIGIAPADRAAVFEPFFRSAEARRAGIAGTGLGLAVATRIAAALGGALTCDSTPGSGSQFVLTLPLESTP
jgi:signal transduction histidine kinase